MSAVGQGLHGVRYEIAASQNYLQMMKQTLKVNLSRVLAAWEWRSRDWNPSLVYSFRPPVGPGLLRPLATQGPQAVVSLVKWLEDFLRLKNGLYVCIPSSQHVEGLSTNK